MKAIIINNLYYSYTPTSEALNNVSLQVERGSFVSIVGHNGCGKSTLAKALMGLIKPAKGEIIIDDVKLEETTVTKIRNKISIVFQNPDNQFIGSTVEDDIAFGLENKNIPQKDMKEIILKNAKRVHMENYLNKEPSFLSGGQKQRVAIAGALALNPEILILDEATSMLDPKGKREVMELLFEMKKAQPNLTIITITHEIEETFLTDYVYVMDKGKVVLEGSPKEVFKDSESISKYHLKKPFIFELKEKLQSINIDTEDCSNILEVVNKLCR